MIRSRSIPAVLSRVTGDGIHAILLVDADGELLGSHGTPPPTQNDIINNIGGTINSTAIANNEKSSHWPLDAASIGALISEVAGDYRRMGEELLLLDPQYDSQRQSAINVDDDGQKDYQQSGSSSSGDGGADEGSSSLQQSGDGGKTGKDKTDSGTNLKSLVIELDYGVVGVASAGPDFYVIALADPSVQHGALAGRLRSLGSHVGEALSSIKHS